MANSRILVSLRAGLFGVPVMMRSRQKAKILSDALGMGGGELRAVKKELRSSQVDQLKITTLASSCLEAGLGSSRREVAREKGQSK